MSIWKPIVGGDIADEMRVGRRSSALEMASLLIDGAAEVTRLREENERLEKARDHWKKAAILQEEFNFGWFWVYAEYPDEGSCGPFEDREKALDHALDSGEGDASGEDYTFWEMKDHRPFESENTRLRLAIQTEIDGLELVADSADRAGLGSPTRRRKIAHWKEVLGDE